MRAFKRFCVILFVALMGKLALGEKREFQQCRVILQGQTAFKAEILNKQGRWDKTSPFSDAVIENGIENILSIYENSGYPYCQVLVDSLSCVSEGQIRLHLRIIEGPLVKVNRVEFSGVSPGVANSLLKKLGFKPEERFSASAWEERARILKNLDYIKTVSGPSLEFDLSTGSASVVIRLEETHNTLGGGLGYVPAQGTKAGYLAGNLSLNFSNFLGGPRQANVVWNKKDLHSYYLNFGYSEHWLFNTPFSFKVDFKQSQTDSTYSQVSVEQQTLYRLSRHLTIASLLSGERVFQKGILKSIFPSGRKLGLGFKLSFNNTDSRENPRQGWEFSALIKIINWRKSDTLSTIQAKTKDRLVEDQQTLSRFIPTWADQSMAFKLSYARVRSQEGDLSPAELFKIGGMGTLRGYLQEQFWSDRVFLTSLEYRFLLKEQGRFYLFTDMAHFAHGFFQNGDLVSRPAFKLGYGLGFWLPSRLGFLGLDLGLGQSDQLNDLKVHLSVQNRF